MASSVFASDVRSSALCSPTPEYVEHITRIHLDPDSGTPYWIERDQQLSAQALARVKTFDDFKRLIGFRDAQDQSRFEHGTRYLPLETFIPKSVVAKGHWIWASQTGGTTGAPKHGTWGSAYWDEVLKFSDEFLDLHMVPRNCNWLFLGPSGPHTTGRLVIAIAEHRGGRCFSIDLDPRIVKVFGSEGMHDAYERYIRHIWSQADPIMRHQDIGVVFCTSRLLEMLPEYSDLQQFRRSKAIVHAGTTMDRDTNRLLKEEFFPGIPIVGIYGTSTTGISFQKVSEPEDEYRVVYIPSSPNIVMEVVDDTGHLVAYEDEGHVSTYRLTEDSLIPGFWERDRALRIRPYGQQAALYPWDWIAEVYSPEFTVEGKVEGVY
jgi:thienamycin biosynthesis protein ThnN